MTFFNSQPRTSKPSLVVLDSIQVAAPCPADWNQMSGDDRFRHCCQCNLNVYNVSEMTRAEAEELIRSHEGRLCVRFFRRTDGTILTQNCPWGLRVLVRRVSHIAAAVLTAVMSVGSSISYAAAKKSAQAEKNEQATSGIDVTVVDPSGAVIQGAKATMCRCNDHISVNVSTDATGIAHFGGLTTGKYLLEIQAPGFRVTRQNVRLRSEKIDHFQIRLHVAPAEVTVDVKGKPVEIMGTMGFVTVVETPIPWPAIAPRGRPGLMR